MTEYPPRYRKIFGKNRRHYEGGSLFPAALDNEILLRAPPGKKETAQFSLAQVIVNRRNHVIAHKSKENKNKGSPKLILVAVGDNLFLSPL